MTVLAIRQKLYKARLYAAFVVSKPINTDDIHSA